LIDSEFRKDISIDAIKNQTVAQIDFPGNPNVTLKTIHMHQLRLAQPLSSHLMKAVWALFASVPVVFVIAVAVTAVKQSLHVPRVA